MSVYLELSAKLILDALLTDKTIEESMIYEFNSAVLEEVRNPSKNELELFDQLARYLESIWRAESYKEFDPEKAFLLGRLFSITNLLQRQKEFLATQDRIEEFAYHNRNYRSVVMAIKRHAGITLEELIEATAFHKSTLKRFLSQQECGEFIIARELEKKTKYYLTGNGDKLYEIVQKNARKGFCKTNKASKATLEKTYHIDLSSWMKPIESVEGVVVDKNSNFTEGMATDLPKLVLNNGDCDTSKDKEKEKKACNKTDKNDIVNRQG